MNGALPAAFFLLLVDAAVAKTSWDTAKLEVVQGDNVTITCSATDVGPMDVLRVFHQECLFHDVKSTIADNDHLKPEFARTNRYTVVYDYDNAMRRASLQVTFTGIRGEDSAYIGCKSLAAKNQSAEFSNLKVLIPVDELYMALTSPNNVVERLHNMSTIELKDGQSIACVITVNGTTSSPITKITLDGEDYKMHFKRKKTTNATVTRTGDTLKYNAANYTYVGPIPPVDLNGRLLSCVVKPTGLEPRKVSVTVIVKFPPVIICDSYRFYAKLGASVSLACRVRANPATTVTWRYGPKEEKALATDETDIMSSTINSLGVDLSSIQLTIDKVEVKHFTDYTITATNVLGSHTVLVKLDDESNRPPEVRGKVGYSVEGKGAAGREGNRATPREMSAYTILFALLCLCLCRV